jgi:hypothetical protein
MSDERAGLKQDITAGDGSQNFQALRDVNVHNHTVSPAAASLIHKPTNAQVAAFDPKTAAVIRAARNVLTDRVTKDYCALPPVVFIVIWIAIALLLWTALRLLGYT